MGLFGFGKKGEATPTINWVKLRTESELTELVNKESFEKPVVLFKHSTRCSISTMALSRLENYWDIEEGSVIPVYLDLIEYRSVSNKIAADLDVRHQSPQVLIVKNGACVYHASHSEILAEEIKRNI